MIKIAVYSVKGGVGKSSVSAGLCYALRDLGLRVGYCEIDISGTSGHKAFGLKAPPLIELDTFQEKMIPPLVNGVRVFCLASKFTEDSAVGWRDMDREVQLSNGHKVVDKGRRGFIEEILTKTIDWVDTEWVVYDLPPSTSTEVWAYFNYIEDLFGVIVVSQPSEISVVGLKKTIDFLKREQRPILGMVSNMDGYLCKHGEVEYQFTSPRVDLKALAKQEKIRFLVSIPQSGNIETLKPYFATLAEQVLQAEPKVLKKDQFSLRERTERRLIKGILGI